MELGSKLKDLRIMLGLTQEELGNRCDLTKGYISQLESDSCSPSISTLEDILSALGTNLHEFFSEDNRKLIFKKDDYFIKEEDNYSITWLVPNSQSNDMEEFGYVLSGSVTLHFNDKKYNLKKGECCYYSSDKAHYLTNEGDKTAKILWVTTPPSF